MLYLDTSVLVASLTREASTTRIQAWLAAQDPELLLISDWTLTELSSALAIQLRTGRLDAQHRAAALSTFRSLLAESLEVASLRGSHFRTAAAFVDRHDLALRAGDALHLAVASDRGATLQTLDRRLAEAGPPLGVPTVLLD